MSCHMRTGICEVETVANDDDGDGEVDPLAGEVKTIVRRPATAAPLDPDGLPLPPPAIGRKGVILRYLISAIDS
eukprot:COSAG05_NODE_147_length_16383_cov_266.102555_22_plen_74_part_00